MKTEGTPPDFMEVSEDSIQLLSSVEWGQEGLENAPAGLVEQHLSVSPCQLSHSLHLLC